MKSRTVAAANFSVTNEDGVPTFHLYDDIGPEYMGMISAEEMAAELDKVKGAPAINVRINSPGGDVFEASGIYNALRRHGGKVNVHVDSLAASAASVIAMAGDTISMAANAMMMIHNAWTVTAGNRDDHLKAADTLSKVDQNICNTYTARTGCPTAEVKQMMADETWMTAQEALSKGFATEISQPLNVPPFNVSKTRFKNTPRQFLGDVADGHVPSNPPGGSGKAVAGEWSKPALKDFTDKSWGELDAAEKTRISEHFAWQDGDTFDGLKFPHHFASGDKAGKPSLDAVNNALARLNQADGLNDAARAKIKAHLDAHKPDDSTKSRIDLLRLRATAMREQLNLV